MAKFETAFNITMHFEGGYANNPNDRGGETYKGIARNFWGSWQGWPIVHAILATKPANLNAALAANAELQAMVLAFYKTNFWDTESLDNINDQQIANQLFDVAVNMGTGAASKFLQGSINTLSAEKITVDGQVGPHTIAAANALNAHSLHDAINAARKAKYEAIIANNPSQAQFRNSWFSRLTPYQVA